MEKARNVTSTFLQYEFLVIRDEMAQTHQIRARKCSLNEGAARALRYCGPDIVTTAIILVLSPAPDLVAGEAQERAAPDLERPQARCRSLV